MIKDLKAWFTKSPTGVATTLNIQVDLINTALQYHVIEDLRAEIATRVAQSFIDENGETLKKEIIKNKNFANSVYNAIVLKEVDRIRK